MQELENAYRVLDLEPGASMEEINQAYKDLVFVWHPDRLPKDNTRLIEKAQDKIKQLNQARDYLRSHGRVGARNVANGYRTRRASYARASSNTGYRQPSTDNPTDNPRRTQHSHQAHQSRYPQSAYGGYGNKARGDGASYRNSSRAETSGNGASNGHKASSSGASNGHRASYRDPRSGFSTAYSQQEGWNNYTTRPPSSGTYGSYYYKSTEQKPADPNSRNGAGSDRQPSDRSTTTRPTSSASSQGAQKSATSRPKQQDPDLSGADMRGADLREKDFSRRNLSSADLSGADLQDAFLHGVNFNRANLTNANLFRANLLQANLSHATLRGANLLGADLSGADLSGADLSGAKVSVGDRVMVKLTGTILRGTIMPDGTINA